MTELEEAMKARRVVLVCHDSVADDDLISGNSDVAIRPSSRAAYEKLRPYLPTDAKLLASPTRRVVQTAKRLFPLAEPESPAGLRGREMGDWDGKSWEELRTHDPVRCEAFWSEFGTFQPPRGESLSQLEERLHIFFQGLTNDQSWDAVVIVTHPEIIRTWICHVLQCDLATALRIRVDALSVTEFSRSWLGWQVVRTNLLPA